MTNTESDLPEDILSIRKYEFNLLRNKTIIISCTLK